MAQIWQEMNCFLSQNGADLYVKRGKICQNGGSSSSRYGQHNDVNYSVWCFTELAGTDKAKSSVIYPFFPAQ